MKTVLIQGAMDSEVTWLIEYYKPMEIETFGGFEFYIANYNGVRIIISQTKIGIINGTEATTIAILKFKPDVVINQGCAGSALIDLKVGDIIVGEKSVYINCYNTPIKQKGLGSDSLEWEAHPKRSYCIDSTDWLLDIAKTMDGEPKFMTLGSGDLFSREYDRIVHLNETFNHACEDMETVACFKVCEDFGVSHIGFRIISNNEMLLVPKDKSTCRVIQEWTARFLDKLIGNWKV